MFLSVAPGAPRENPVRGFGTCSSPPRVLQSGASFCRILSVASDAPVRGTGFTPGRSSPGASAALHSAPDAPFRGALFSYSFRCLGCSSPWHRVHPQTIQSGGLGRAPLRPGCSNPGRLFVAFSPLPRMLQSVAPGSPPDDPVRGLVPCFIPPRMLQSGASFYHILSVASDAPVRGTGFIPGRSSPGAWAELRSAPNAPIRGVIVSYSLCCLRRLRVWCIGAFFFFACPSSLLLPRSPGSALLSLPPFPLPLRPRHPRSRFSLPLLPFPPFVVALLGHALKLLVSTRACCYVLGRAHTFILLLSFLPSLCSRALFLFTSLPLSHALCVAFAYFLTSPLLFVWGTHTSFYSYACSLPPSSSHSFCTLAARYLCVSPRIDTVGNAAANSPLAFRPTRFRHPMESYLFFPSWILCFLATPKSKRVLMHAWRCMLFTRWFVDSLYSATPKSRRVCLVHSCHATYSLCLGLFVFCNAQE